MKTFSRALGALFCSSALVPLGFASAAWAAPAPTPAAAAASQEAVEEVVVTGSRIISNGFAAPTPVTTVTAQSLEERSPTNIPDALNQLPQFRNSLSPQNSANWNLNSPQQGNFLNLRGLGSQRSIILLDGVRVPPTTNSGAVDTNTLPQSLVSRVDVVTGGASAAYGSDAVVGAVNFILDKYYNGVKGSISSGISSRGDNENYRASLAAGAYLFGQRAHIEGSIDHYWSRGLPRMSDRDGGDEGYFFLGTGQTEATQRVLIKGVLFGNQTYGGLIRSGALSGQRFQPDGTLVPFVPGQIVNNTYQIGGDGAEWEDVTLNSALRTTQGFGRFSFDFTPNLVFHAQAAVSQARNRAHNFWNFQNPPVTIFTENAFLRPEVRTRLGTAASFTLGRMDRDMPAKESAQLTNTSNINIGFEGRVADNWRWDLTYVRGRARFYSNLQNDIDSQRLYAALDAVRDPAGNIVCRTNLTNPGLYPGCVPLNLFGEGAPSAQAIAYISETAKFRIYNSMDIVAFNAAGDLFDLWAGPLSVAFGAEYRTQKLNQTGNGDPGIVVPITGLRGAPITGISRFQLVNVGPAFGTQKVKEVYGEVNVPLLRELPFAQALDLNVAARLTDYRTSGTVTTWKVGLSYTPFNDLRIRSTLSRDIAAPSLYQLFAGPQVSVMAANDIHTGSTGNYNQRTESNPNLTPEIGRMLVAGAVYSPSWLEGFTVSVDAYQLLIQDSISNSSNPVQECEDSGGLDPLCALITRPFPFSNRTPQNIYTQIIFRPINVSKTYQAGLDLEAAYTFPVSRIISSVGGNLELRVLASHLQHVESKNAPTLALSTENVGIGSNVKWRGSVEVAYRNGPLNVRVANRFTGKSLVSRTVFYEPSQATNPNKIYTDLSISYAFMSDRRLEGFINVQNLFDVKYPIQGSTVNPGLTFPTSKSTYDVIGTMMTAGVRFRM
jgi:outer membrane receptor protein involved in Fe transport